MTAIDFLARIAVTGTVAGLGIGSSAGEVRGALGDSCVADRRKRSLRLDYGLLEFSLFAERCEGIAIQVHRLALTSGSIVPDILKTSLSGLGRTITLEAFRGAIQRNGVHSLERLQGQSGYQCYRLAGSHVIVFVVDKPTGGDESLAPGDLWSIMISSGG